ncbi:hypothetical protein ACYCNP_14585 [Citrobacter braakii]
MATNHPANGPVSLDRLHQISEILSKAAAQSDGGNLGYAMADAVKVIDEVLNAEPVAYMTYKGYLLHASDPELAEYSDPTPLYDALPAPVAMKDHQIRELVNDLRDIAIEYHGTQQLRERIARTVRAAMLQAGNSPVTPDGYVLVPKKLTAENGAKGVLSGEFSETKFINCPECFGDDDCETCDSSGRIEITVPVTWTTIKAIWTKGVEHFAAAPQHEVK